MEIKKLRPMQRVAIIISTLMIVTGFLVISQIFSSYIEVREASNGCYDKGGFPTIEKSGLSIDYFNCDMN
ncbi:hypothetical protein GN156_11175 [bacterium LRH843]|nr:hypothetical protein [bacterium LRH843]